MSAISDTTKQLIYHRDALEQLECTEADLRGILDAFPDIYFWFDQDGTYRRFHAMTETYVDSTIFLNRSISEVMPPDLVPMMMEAFHRAIETKTIVEIEYPLTVNNDVHWYEARLQLLDSGQVLSIIRDITARKDTQTQLTELLEQHRVDALRLSEQAIELERSNCALETFAEIASHDMREPLRMVSSFCQLLKGKYVDQLDNEANRYLDFAIGGANRLQLMIRDLLGYSRLGNSRIHFCKVPLRESIDHAIDNMKIAIVEAAVSMEIGPMPTLLCDPMRWTQVFQNLISNSIKFRSPAPLLIRIFCQETDDSILIFVEDNGIGILPQFCKRVFQMFQRLHTADAFPGSGLGLTICQRIIELHRGEISIRPNELRGATVVIEVRRDGNVLSNESM